MKAETASPAIDTIARPPSRNDHRAVSPSGDLTERLMAVELDRLSDDDDDDDGLELYSPREYAMDQVDETPTAGAAAGFTDIAHIQVPEDDAADSLCLMCNDESLAEIWDPLPCCGQPICTSCSARITIRTVTLAPTEPNREPQLRCPYLACGQIFLHAMPIEG